MRSFNSKKTHAKELNPITGDKQELTEIFISGYDGTLTTYVNDHEVEITGCTSTIFVDGFSAIVK